MFLAGDGEEGSVLPMVRASLIERTCSESLGLHTEKCLFGEREKVPSQLFFSVMARWDYFRDLYFSASKYIMALKG